MVTKTITIYLYTAGSNSSTHLNNNHNDAAVKVHDYKCLLMLSALLCPFQRLTQIRESKRKHKSLGAKKGLAAQMLVLLPLVDGFCLVHLFLCRFLPLRRFLNNRALIKKANVKFKHSKFTF